MYVCYNIRHAVRIHCMQDSFIVTQRFNCIAIYYRDQSIDVFAILGEFRGSIALCTFHLTDPSAVQGLARLLTASGSADRILYLCKAKPVTTCLYISDLHLCLARRTIDVVS